MNGDMLDTNVIIKYLTGDESTKQLVNSATDILVPVIVVGELQYGARKSSKTATNLALFADFLSNFTIAHVDESIAAMYGEVKEQLRKKGVNVPENDIWIAATAISQQCRLITYDAHFKSVDGLDVVC